MISGGKHTFHLPSYFPAPHTTGRCWSTHTVVQVSSPTVSPLQLVSVVQGTARSTSTRVPPLVVGRLTMNVMNLNPWRASGKEKAVHVLHTWKDHLFDMGNKADPPGEIETEEDEGRGEDAPKSGPTGADEKQESVPDDVATDPNRTNGAASNVLPPAESLAPTSVPIISTSAPSKPAFSKEGENCLLETIPRLKPQQRSPTSYALLSSKPSRPRSPPLHARLFPYRQAPSTRHTSYLSGLHSFTSPRLMDNYLSKRRLRTRRLTSSTLITSLSSRFSRFWISNGFCQ
jgi:hypothetical protein